MRTLFLSPQMDVLDGKNFRVHVQLIGRKGDELLVDETFEFSLVCEPDFKLEENESLSIVNTLSEGRVKRQYIIERLQEFIRQDGEVNAPGFIDISDPRFGQGLAWYARAERFLRDYYDEEHVQRFKKKGVIVLEELLKKLLDE